MTADELLELRPETVQVAGLQVAEKDRWVFELAANMLRGEGPPDVQQGADAVLKCVELLWPRGM